MMEYGAFVRLEAGIEGLVHISEISHKRVFRVSDVLQEGQEIEAKVLTVDTASQRLSLSLKALEARPEPEKKPEDQPPSVAKTPTPPKKRQPAKQLKGGLGNSSGGDRFGLRW
jgi:small subunit ribosomal protein S1